MTESRGSFFSGAGVAILGLALLGLFRRLEIHEEVMKWLTRILVAWLTLIALFMIILAAGPWIRRKWKYSRLEIVSYLTVVGVGSWMKRTWKYWTLPRKKLRRQVSWVIFAGFLIALGWISFEPYERRISGTASGDPGLQRFLVKLRIKKYRLDSRYEKSVWTGNDVLAGIYRVYEPNYPMIAVYAIAGGIVAFVFRGREPEG